MTAAPALPPAAEGLAQSEATLDRINQITAMMETELAVMNAASVVLRELVEDLIEREGETPALPPLTVREDA